MHPFISTIGAPSYQLLKCLTCLLAPLLRCCPHYMNNSKSFVDLVDSLSFSHSELLLSLDVVSLFTYIPLHDILELFKSLFSFALFHQVLTSIYFLYSGQYYEQSDDVPWVLPCHL